MYAASQFSMWRYIHDECYGVALDAEGNYLIIGGWNILIDTDLFLLTVAFWPIQSPTIRSGDEYDYEETNADGWSSDTWVRTQPVWLSNLLSNIFLSARESLWCYLFGSLFLGRIFLHWSSSQVSYLVVISPSGETVFSGVFGDKEGNNAGKGTMFNKITKEGNNVSNKGNKGGEKWCRWEKVYLNNFPKEGDWLTAMQSGDMFIDHAFRCSWEVKCPGW